MQPNSTFDTRRLHIYIESHLYVIDVNLDFLYYSIVRKRICEKLSKFMECVIWV